MQIRKVDNNVELVTNFLKKIDSIKEIENDILKNGSYIEKDNQILGYITYETFSEYGLIRYFIFERQIEFDIILEMFISLVNNARKQSILSLIAIGKNNEVVELFESLGFYEIDNNNLIINHNTLEGTDLESAIILKYDLIEESN